MKKDVVVIGIGNVLMSDEGVGCYIVERLAQQAAQYPFADFIDAGTGGLSILHLIADRRKAVIIDCAYMGTEPGTIKQFTPEDVASKKTLAHHSLHEADVLKIIAMAKKLDQCPSEVVIFGIEPKRIEPGQKLSGVLAVKMDTYTATVTEALGK